MKARKTTTLSIALSGLGEDDLPPVDRETHGPGVCGYCGERNAVLKTEPRSQRSYCRKCAPGRETDADWPSAPCCSAIAAALRLIDAGSQITAKRMEARLLMLPFCGIYETVHQAAARILADEMLRLRLCMQVIANMPEYDQDDAHRLRDKAQRCLAGQNAPHQATASDGRPQA